MASRVDLSGKAQIGKKELLALVRIERAARQSFKREEKASSTIAAFWIGVII